MTRRGSTWSGAVKWIRRIILSVLVLAVLVAAGFAAVSLIGGNWHVDPVVSGSMSPGLDVGGVAISQRIPVDQLVLRDVIVFKDPQDPANLVMSRIVSLTENKSGQLVIQTQGDENSIKDPWTLTIRRQHAYVVRSTLPLLGYAAVAFENHRGLFLLGAGVLALVIAAVTILESSRREEERERADELAHPVPTPSPTPVPVIAAKISLAETSKVSYYDTKVIPLFYDEDEWIRLNDPPTLEEYTENRSWNDRY